MRAASPGSAPSLADRIGASGIAGELKRLAATTAEINLAAITALARLRHPLRSPEALEEGRLSPDPCQRVLAHGGSGKIEVMRDGEVAGAVSVSGGTIDQNQEVAEAGHLLDFSKAVPNLGLREVAETIAGHCRERKRKTFANQRILESL